MKRRPYQFSIVRLLVLTTVMAFAISVARALSVTLAGEIVLGFYFGALAAWAVMRWPDVYASLKEVRSRRRAILEQRQALTREVDQRRQDREDRAD